MNLKQRYNFARLLLFFGGLLSCAWAIVSLLDLFDLVSETSHGWRVIRAFGPLGLGGVILGGVLCGWDLPSLKKQVEGERE